MKNNLIEKLENMGYEIDEFNDKFSKGFFVFDGRICIAEVHYNGTYVVGEKANEDVAEVIAEAFKKEVEK